MNKAAKYSFLFTNLIILATSCIEKIEFRGTGMEPKIVLYSIMQPDSIITVYVSKSHEVFNYKYKPEQIADASVKLYCNGDYVETLTYVAPPEPSESDEFYSYSEYKSQDIKPIYRNSYRIEATVPGFETVAGETHIPEYVPIINVDTASYKQDEMSVYLVTKVRFNDPSDVENYYMVSGSQTTGHYAGNPDEPLYPVPVVSIYENDLYLETDDEPLITPNSDEDILGIYSYNYFRIFNDELIMGKQYELTLKFDYAKVDTAYMEFSHSKINLISISRDLFMYLLTYSGYIEAKDKYISEPVLVYTNIENGLGVIGAKVTSSAVIKIGRYPVNGVIYQEEY